MYQNLPIFKKALELNVYIETIVKNFSKYNKYAMGSELREKARETIYGIYKVFLEDDKSTQIKKLRNSIEELKITIFLAKELKIYNSFKQFEILSGMAYEIAKQAKGWQKSLSRNHTKSKFV